MKIHIPESHLAEVVYLVDSIKEGLASVDKANSDLAKAQAFKDELDQKSARLRQTADYSDSGKFQEIAGVTFQSEATAETIAHLIRAVFDAHGNLRRTLAGIHGVLPYALQYETDRMVHEIAVSLLPAYGEWLTALHVAKSTPKVVNFVKQYAGRYFGAEHTNPATEATAILPILEDFAAGQNPFEWNVPDAPTFDTAADPEPETDSLQPA